MKSNCDDIGPLVEGWRDGILGGEQARLVEGHLAHCDECSFSPEHELLGFAEEFGFTPAADDRWRSVLVPRATARAPRGRLTLVAFIGLAASLLAVGTLGGLILMSSHESRVQPAPAGAAYGSFGTGAVTSAAAAPQSPGVTILSEGDVLLEVNKGDRDNSEVR
ncbi:MAG: zf-HC2 domain-containing protein [Planctomycetes bacterium]|nr:zf-HC2 domain-containing protein [Planctomycetota bacterium]